MEAARLALIHFIHWGPHWRNRVMRVYPDNSTTVSYICKQGGIRSWPLSENWNFIMSSNSARFLNSHTSPRSSQCNSRSVIPAEQTKSKRMETTLAHIKQSILWLAFKTTPDLHVRDCPEQSDSRLCVALPKRENLGDRRALNILWRLRLGLRLFPRAHSPLNSGEARLQ